MSDANLVKRVTIVGAGFAGLASAFYLTRAGYAVEIFEAQDRPGGLISTFKTPQGLVETAANGFLNTHLVEDLFSTLGVPLIGTKRSARRRFIFRAGRGRRWPIGWGATLRVAWFFGSYVFSRRSLIPRAGESISTWGERALGSEASHYLVDAALQGIYAGDTSRMSAALILGRFFKRETKPKAPHIHGSVAPAEGMGQLIEALVTYLFSKGTVIHYGSRFDLTKRAANQPVIVATAPKDAAVILQPVSALRANLLREVEMSPVVTTTAFFNQTDPATKGFGLLFAPIERRRALGVLKNNFIFENRATSQFSETWIQGGALANKDVTSQSDEQVIDSIVSERLNVFHLSERPTAFVMTRWPEGIPHYTLELQKMIPELEKHEQNIFLMGNYLGDLGLAKILERASKLPERLAREGQW